MATLALYGQFRFDPRQRRGPDGQWIDDGVPNAPSGGSGPAKKPHQRPTKPGASGRPDAEVRAAMAPGYNARLGVLKSGVQSGITKKTKLGGGKLGIVRRVELNDGTQAIFKEAQTGVTLPGGALHTVEDQNSAEELSALIAGQTRTKAPVVYKKNAHQSYQQIAPGHPANTVFPMNERGELVIPDEIANGYQGQRIGVLDVLLDNSDRHTGNWLVDDENNLYAIDHGFAFADRGGDTETSAARGSLSRAFINEDGTFKDENPLTPNDIEYLRERLDAVRPSFAQRQKSQWLDQAVARLDRLAAGARGTEDIYFPAPAA